MRRSISRELAQYPSVHAMVRCLSLSVKHSVEFMGKIMLNTDATIGEAMPGVTISDSVTVWTKVCFDNGAGRRTHRVLTGPDALAEFCKRCGLKATKARSEYFQEGQKVHRVAIFNTFVISGDFEVTDRDLFLKALYEGVGARGSYGYGFVVVLK